MDGSAHQIASLLALTTGVAWASGINLYAAMLLLGLMAANGAIGLPPELQVLAHPWVIGAAGLMYVIEFFTDKVPGVDTAWDTLHTFIRIPAGAILAAGAVGELGKLRLKSWTTTPCSPPRCWPTLPGSRR